MSPIYIRVLEKKQESGLSWSQICKQAHIRMSSWMTGVPFARIKDSDLKAIAPVLNTTFEYLKYGTESDPA